MANLDQCPVCKLVEEEDVPENPWIQCTTCKQWLHIICIKLDPVPGEDESWFCEKCVEANATGVNSSESNNVKTVENNATPCNSDDEELKMLNAAIMQQEKLCALQQRRLELLDRKSQKDSNERNENGKHRNVVINARSPKRTDVREVLKIRTQADGVTGIIHTSNSKQHVNHHNSSSTNNDNGISNLLQTQMQLMCRSYLEELPIFDGDVEFWPVFYAQFKSTTAEGGFSDAHNLCRLRKCLKGEALKAVQGLLTIPDSLNYILEILEQRFGSMQVIVKRNMEKLGKLTSPNESKPSTVRNFHEFLRGLYATLLNAGAHDYLNSPQTVDAAFSKLPPNMMRSWIAHRKDLHRVNLLEFILWFERYYECAVLNDCDQSDNLLKKSRVHMHKGVTEINARSTPATESCPCCKKSNHNLANCEKFGKLALRVRWDFVRKRRLCFLCLVSKHAFKDCSATVKCGVNGCDESHHKSLHWEKRKLPSHNEESVDAAEKNVVATVKAGGSSFDKTHFRLLPVVLYNPTKNINITTWAFLDDGSSPTMISAVLARKLDIRGMEEELCTAWTDSTIRKEPKSQRVTVDISGITHTRKYRLHNVRTVEELHLPMPEFNITQLKSKYKHLADIEIPNIPFKRPEILIGLEHPKLGLSYESREGSWHEPVATKTRLGWTIHGKECDGAASEFICHVCECGTDKKVDEMVRQFFTTESFGVKMMDRYLACKEDEHALAVMERTTRKVGDQYETGLIWKNQAIQLPDNRAMAMKRLVCFEQKLNRDRELREIVLEKIKSHLEKGYLRRLKGDESASLTSIRHWYLPVFSVANMNKGGKVRLVFDAAARFKGISLNDVLCKGPDQVSSLFGVLLRFREGKVALAADIAEMFHRVKINREDQYCQLILWRDLDVNREPDTLVMTALTFGSTSSPSSAQFVKNLNASQFKDEMPRAVEAIVKRHYVDDWLDSFPSVDDAVKVARQVKFIHKQAGFDIRNWISNSAEVLTAIDGSFGSNRDVNLNMLDRVGEEKVLGLHWNTSCDEFLFKLSFSKVDPLLTTKVVVPTKREVLRMIMSVYDPLGFLSIVTVYGKILLQEIWRTGIMWDDKIPNDLLPMWHYWLDSLNEVGNVKISRCYFMRESEEFELHVMCDASEAAFAACAYLRSKISATEFETSLVAAKTKVAPQKSLSVPRLELQACLLASRLLASIKAELTLPISEVIMWTDSKTALGWIRSTKRKFSSFVSHRVSEILEATTFEQWRWVPSNLNVADDATRGVNIPTVSSRWIFGPEFLINDCRFWPVEKCYVTNTDEEVRRVYMHTSTISDTCAMIQCSRFSKYERLLHTVAYVHRFICCCKEKKRSKNSCPTRRNSMHDKSQAFCRNLIPALTGDELRLAEKTLFHKVQAESYGNDIIAMQSNKSVSKRSRIFTLNPYLDSDGLIRLAGRLDAAPIVENVNVKRPILLDGRHRITELLIDWVHRKFHHRGKELVVNEVRQMLWIPKLRVVVNRVFQRCNFCKYLKARAVVPIMAPLPPERLHPYLPVFSNTGTDFFGPLEVTVGRRIEKRWGMIFTCLASRAIHLELASSLDTSSAIMCFRNFINRRGMPITIFSDNGTNLRGAEKELRGAVESLNYENIKTGIMDITPNATKINWVFIPPGAPNFGGIWERMIRIVKSVLYIILKSKTPRDETLRSALIEIENMVNSRPLTYASTDIDEPPSITPNLLLRGPGRDSIPLPGDFNCRKQWKIAQALAESFWHRWLREYIPVIANRTKWYTDTNSLRIGQVVLIIEESLRRGEWKKGVVERVFPSIDGKIRSAEVRTAKGTYIRPVSKLAVIKGEVVSSDDDKCLA